MPSTFFGLQIGKSGLYTYQAHLETTAHNITNRDTKGYSRQQIIQEASTPLRVYSRYGLVGTGVDVVDRIQIRDQYYDTKYRLNNKLEGEYNIKQHHMKQIENFFNELELEGFHNTFNKMLTGLQELSKNPSSLDTRVQVNNTAIAFTEFFNQINTNLLSIQEEVNTEIMNQVEKINTLSEQIATCTRQINMLEVQGRHANDLRDKRNNLLDELSNIATINITENKVGDGEYKLNDFRVTLDGHTLIDADNVCKLAVFPREDRTNISDIKGLYEVKWSTGEAFNILSPSLGGILKGLIEMRDGNNKAGFSGVGKNDPLNNKGSNKLVVADSNINSIDKLNISRSGVIVVGNREYKYSEFDVKKVNGKYEYTFTLDEPLTEDAINENIRIGEQIDYKGIPHYMAKLNEFVRVFSREFNDVHKKGLDLNNEKGLDYFTTKDIVTGELYALESDPNAFSSRAENTTNGGNNYFGNYYLITASNFSVNDLIVKDPSKFVTGKNVINGVEQNDIVMELIEVGSNKIMFKQGTPRAFIQTLVDEIGVDAQKANSFLESQQNILHGIENQRLSVQGVDEDEEGFNLVRYQRAYNMSSKVISIMNEVLETLINRTGV